MKKKSLIIADDFTGANDTGIQLRKRGIETEVMIFPRGEKVDYSIVLDTESRTISSSDSYDKVYNLSNKILQENNFDIVYKKVDSTIRGNISSEIKAVADVYKPDRIIFAPAFPKINRTTKSNIHYLNDIPLMETEMAKDPLNPIHTDNLVSLMKDNFKEPCQTYSVEELTDSLVLKEGYIHIFDIETDKQLNLLAKRLLNIQEKILYVGSAGLAESLFKEVYPSNPLLAVVGSISQVSLDQVNFAEKAGINTITIDINDLVLDSFHEQYTEKVRQSLINKQDTIITVTRKKSDFEDTVALFNKLGKDDQNEISRIIKEALALIAINAITDIELSGIFLTGGDTAIEIISQTEATGCLIGNEIETGVVQSKIKGGQLDGLNIITKAGAFGKENVIIQCINYLSENGGV